MAEVMGFISAIITIVEASIKIYRTATDISDLPPSFSDAASRLPLVQDTLKLAADGLVEDALEPESHAPLTAVLKKCTDRAAVLLDIFQSVIIPVKASRTDRYIRALKTIPQAEKVETLMDGIMVDLQLLAANHIVKAATRKQMERLISKTEVDNKPYPASIVMNNFGSGRQFVHNGTGDQNVVMSTGMQINGSIHGGTFSFYENSASAQNVDSLSVSFVAIYRMMEGGVAPLVWQIDVARPEYKESEAIVEAHVDGAVQRREATFARYIARSAMA
ncbi:hypothetical protein Neosp_003219 [[Neocosmospora] mangrovei]